MSGTCFQGFALRSRWLEQPLLWTESVAWKGRLFVRKGACKVQAMTPPSDLHIPSFVLLEFSVSPQYFRTDK